jgi:hypothetical protein
MSSETVLPGDIVIHSGKRQAFPGNVFVNGWVTVRGGGRFECTGYLHCLGMSLENDAFVGCAQLSTNVLEVDRDARGKPPTLEVSRIQARVVHHVQLALRDLIDKDAVKADYIQHFGGEQNPGSDYVRGTNPLAEEFYDERGDGDAVVLETAVMQAALGSGKTIFRRMQPLVPPRSKLDVAAATRDPMVEELTRWLDAHPGPQRATLDRLEAEWRPKLASLSPAARADAMFVIKRTIKSPKLAERIQSLRVEIDA